MKQTKALRRMLEDMAAVYNDGEGVPVAFTTGTPHASETGGGRRRDRCDCDVAGKHVAVATNVRQAYGKSLTGADELRVVVDTLNHEMEHIRSSPLTAKKEFSEQYPRCPEFAGLVLNILEDQFIDWQRLKRFRGLRAAHSFKVDAIMSNGSRRPPLFNLDQGAQVTEGFLQMAFSGYVKGFSKAPREVQEAIVRCRPLVDAVRNEYDPDRREQIAHTCMDILLEAVPDPQEAEDYTDANSDGMPTDEPADLTDEEIQDLLDNLEPEDLERGQQEGGQTVEIDPEQFDVPEWLEDEMEQAEGGSGGQQAEQEGAGEGAGGSPEDGQAGEDAQQGGDEGGREGEQGGEGEAGDETEGSTPEDGEGDGTPGSAGGVDEGSATAGGDGEPNERSTAAGHDPVEQGIQEMERAERDRRAGDHWAAGNVDYSQADEDFRRRYDTIRREVKQEGTEMGQQKRRRQERIDSADRYASDRSDRVREVLREEGLAEQIVAAFKMFKTQDRWLPSQRGERLNTRNAVRRLAGDYTEDRVYDHKLKAEVGDRVVGVAMDLSSSMSSYDGLLRPKMALGALYLATRTIGDDLLAAGYKTYRPGLGHDNHPTVGKCDPVLDLITAPGEGFEWDHLDAAQPGRLTPTADGIMYTLKLLKTSHRREKVLVCITDGKANIPLGGSSSTNSDRGRLDAKKAVNTARQQGVKVIGMAVGGVGAEYMDDVFNGRDNWVHTSSDTLADDLVELYRSQMRVDPAPVY